MQVTMLRDYGYISLRSRIADPNFLATGSYKLDFGTISWALVNKVCHIYVFFGLEFISRDSMCVYVFFILEIHICISYWLM